MGLILCFALVFSSAGGSLPQGVGAEEPVIEYPIMHPDEETMERWIEAYNEAPRVQVGVSGSQTQASAGSQDLLSHLDYVPSERSQGGCGNCWAWAGTGCLGIALDVQEGIKDRLSVQYLNSCETAAIGKTCCHGGWLYEVADFYTCTGLCIPWSNANANWQSSDGSCGPDCGSISTVPSYPISSIDDVTITTQTVDRETAIANIKYELDQDRAVWFAFFLPTSAAWSDFYHFWSYDDESDIYDMDKFCSESYEGAGGHAVLCVGYSDGPGTANDYWVMLNSWGTTAGRPNGLFRVDMDMAYDGASSSCSFFWQTLDVTFDIPDGLEYGDAPVPYPSLLASDGARHSSTDTEILGLASEGDSKDGELDARVPGQDLFDDGLVYPVIAAGNPTETLAFEITDFAAPSSDLRLNVLIDLNGDGDWCDAGEHAVQNQPVTTTAAGTEERVVVSVSFSTVGATPGQTWLRMTLARSDIENLPWDGTMEGHAQVIPFDCGETEDWEITILEEAVDVPISGVTGEVNCDVLPSVDLALFKYGAPEGSPVVSDGDGNFIIVAPRSGVYTAVASKDGFYQQARVVLVGTDPVALNFRGGTGLVPQVAEMSYVLKCVNHWLYPEGGCGLEMSPVLEVVNAWLYPAL